MKKSLSVLIALILAAIMLSGTALAASELRDPVAINNVGYYLYKQGHYDVAEKLFLRALELDPDYELARANLAITRNAFGDYGGAADALTELTAIDPTNTQYWYDLGVNEVEQFRTQTGKVSDFYAGLNAYEQAAKLDPGYAHVQENIEVLYRIKAEFGI